jgi:hypothetical protein
LTHESLEILEYKSRLEINYRVAGSDNLKLICLQGNTRRLRLMVVKVLSTIFQFIVAVSFIGGGNLSTWRKPLTCHKSLTNFITQCCIEYTSPATSH